MGFQGPSTCKTLMFPIEHIKQERPDLRLTIFSSESQEIALPLSKNVLETPAVPHYHVSCWSGGYFFENV